MLESDGPCSIIAYDVIMDLLEYLEDNIDIHGKKVSFPLLDPVVSESILEQVLAKEKE